MKELLTNIATGLIDTLTFLGTQDGLVVCALTLATTLVLVGASIIRR